MVSRLYILLILLCASVQSFAQPVTDYAIQLKADVQTSPASVTLSWNALPAAVGYTIYRKNKTATTWGSPIATITATSYIDNSVSTDAAYEYQVKEQLGDTAFGYVYAGIKAPPMHNRGALLLLVDTAMGNNCPAEIDRLMKDLSGDGWQVIRKDFASSVTDVTVRNFIISTQQTYNSLAAVYVLGHIAVPYSGNINPDGHPDHLGAWPADVYYADINDTWTDNSINSTTASRPENKNIPGDGKWDQSMLPGNLELEVGRVDFSNMPTFAKTDVTMMKSYLNRAHTYKMDSLNVVKRALIDDNFGGFSGEAFAANAYRNFPVLVGKDSIKSVDLVTTLNTKSYQWAYGCGGGSYTSAGGIGATADFKTNNVNSIFIMMFGSYFGDWAAQNNFLRAPLCSNVPALASCWAGRPNWFMHHMALGENIGYSTLLSQNNSIVYAPTNYGARFIHSALLGDPSLRTDYIKPASNVVLTSAPTTGANLTWTASPDVAVIGYYVYRSDDRFGAYTKRSDLVTTTSFKDTAGANGLKYYMVRPVKLQSTPSGTYYNLGIGDVDSEFVYYPVSVKDEPGIKGMISIYPNPATHTLNLVMSANAGINNVQLQIIDVAGKMVFTGRESIKNATTTIDISNLTPGIYHLVVTAGNKLYTQQFVKTGQ